MNRLVVFPLFEESGQSQMRELGFLAKKLAKPSAISISDHEKKEPPPINNQVSYGDLLHMNDAFAYCKCVFDEYGKPVDYIFADVNKAYMRLTKLNGKSIIGRAATEVVPGLKDESFDWIGPAEGWL